MITITTNHDWAKSVADLKEGLINTVNDQLEEYEPEDTGWSKYSKEEISTIIDRYLNEATDEEIDNFNEDNYYGDRDEAIMCYLNEWFFDEY
jgi:hypothetical protein